MRNWIHILDLHYILLFCYNVFVLKNCQNLHIFTMKVTFCLDIVSLFLGWGWSGQNYQILLARSRRNSMSPYFVKHWRSGQVYFKSEINSNKELITHRNWLSYFHQRGENRNTDWEELVTEFEKLTLQGFNNSPQIQYSECISICSSRFTHRKSIFSFSRVRSRSCISHLKEQETHFKPSLFSAVSTFSGCQPSSTLNK